MDLEILSRMNDWSTGELKPDLTFLLDLPPEMGLRRKRESKAMDRIEKESLAFHRRVRDGYLKISGSEPDRFVVIPADGEIENIQSAIRETMDLCLLK
jgi:dTMP kinase